MLQVFYLISLALGTRLPMPSFEETINIVNKELQVSLASFLEETTYYMTESVEPVSNVIILYIALCLIYYFLVTCTGTLDGKAHFKGAKRVLFVTAHPDDECMFFGPAIVRLTHDKKCEVYLLCLSKGDFYGVGSVRKNELWKSCDILGIDPSNITICMNMHLPDDPASNWDEALVGDIILRHIEAYSVDTVVTFDKEGISGHSNHTSIFFALASLCIREKLPEYCRVFTLDSINKLRKYSGILDCPISYMTSPHVFPVTYYQRHCISAAMAAHTSQLLWFRRLYMMFSRYGHLNSFKQMQSSDLQFDLELNGLTN